MTKIPVYQEGLQYTDEVRSAVRYGFRYRKEAEMQEFKAGHACLDPEPEFLLWLAKVVLDGLTWDMIKTATKGLFNFTSKPLEQKLNSLLTDEEKLKEFYDDIKEFNEQRMTITEKQFQYIREEIEADVLGEELGEIYSQENRQPTIQEIIDANRKAKQKADSILGSYSQIS